MFELVFRGGRKVSTLYHFYQSQIITRLKLKGNGVTYGSGHKYNGVPVINIHREGSCHIGKSFSCNSGNSNPIGRNSKTFLIVGERANLKIGDCVGISNTAINCYESIVIGNHVKIGGGVVIYDTDFHSLSHLDRFDKILDKLKRKTSPIIIQDHAFIGAHSTILKGVTIGTGSIIGACSVVTKSVPNGEVWAGNPAQFIKKVCCEV